MPRLGPDVQPAHSGAWIAQTWIAFVLSLGLTAIGIYELPVDLWVKGFMTMGLVFSVGSSITLAKTLRDQHEQSRLSARIDDARVSKLIAEHDPLASGM
jgi:hypothetical protein